MSTQAEKGIQGKEQPQAAGESRFQTLLQHSADAIVLMTAEGLITDASESLQNLLGYTPAECIGTLIFNYLHPDDTVAIASKLAEVLQAPGAQVTVEYRARHKNGSWVWLEATGSNYLHDSQIQAIIGNFRNVTERKQLEVVLQQERERQRLLR
jgi:PAS domain S-box-containing protein